MAPRKEKGRKGKTHGVSTKISQNKIQQKIKCERSEFQNNNDIQSVFGAIIAIVNEK